MTLENGYEMKTTFWQDFTIADAFGYNAVVDTYNRAFNDWKNNIIYVTELAMVMSWKSFEHYEKHNKKLYELYADYYHKTDAWCLDNFKGKDLQHYLKTTD